MIIDEVLVDHLHHLRLEAEWHKFRVKKLDSWFGPFIFRLLHAHTMYLLFNSNIMMLFYFCVILVLKHMFFYLNTKALYFCLYYNTCSVIIIQRLVVVCITLK